MATVTSEAAVANLALGAVGQRQFLDNLNEATTEAQVVRVYYALARDEVLAAWWWKFATKRAALALTTETRTGWAYTYAAPSDMVVARYLWSGERMPGSGQAPPFEPEMNDAGTGQLICTDMEEAELIYTRTAPSVALWPPHFVKAVAATLASYVAGALPVKPELAVALQRQAVVALQMAAAIDGNQAQADELADSEIIRVR